MNIEHLKLFVRIASIHNISLAGREFSLSPAVSSSYINKLEESLGVRLIHRTTRNVSLTEDGQAFLPHALNVLESIETACASVGAGSLRPQGKLRVTAPASFGRMHLLPTLNEFLQSNPDLRIDLHLSDSIVDMVEGGFDIAIRDAALNDSSLIARKLAPVNRIVCASPDYLAKYGKPSSPEDLCHHNCVNLMGLETWTFCTPKGQMSIKTNNPLRIDNGEAARDASVKGIGITLSSTWCCYEHIVRGDLVQILKDYPLVSDTSIWAVYPSSRLLALKVRAFIDYYLAYFTEEPYWEKEIKSVGY
ncbi:MAG: LysR family transcriptional regulator [Pseudomonadota bacterium]